LSRLNPKCFAYMSCAILLISSIAYLGCDDKTTNTTNNVDNRLVLMRENGSEIEFGENATAYVWCGEWESEVVQDYSLHVWFGSLGSSGGWVLKAVVADLTIGDTLRFPNHFIWDHPDSVHIFLYDPPNELATNTEESSGYIVFHSLPCPGGGNVDFTIDAVLGSEYGDMPWVSILGRFTAEETGAYP